MKPHISPFGGAQFWNVNISCMAERHSSTSKPGFWHVWICEIETLNHFHAVQDDFGNLVRVS